MNNSLRKLTAGLTALMVMATMTSVAAFAEPGDDPEDGSAPLGTTPNTTDTEGDGSGDDAPDPTLPGGVGDLDGGEPDGDGETETEESTWDALKKALEEDSSYELKNDITIPSDVSSDPSAIILLQKDFTINGNGHQINYESSEGKTLFVVTGEGNTLKLDNVVLNTNSKHGVQAYNRGATVEIGGNTVINHTGQGYAVQANGGAAHIDNATVNSTGWGAVEFGMGSGITTIPTVIIGSNVSSTNENNFVVADSGTMGKIKDTIDNAAGMTDDELAAALNEKLKDKLTVGGEQATVTGSNGTFEVIVPEAPASDDSGDDSDSTSSSRDSGGSGESELTRQRREAVNRLWKSTRNALLEAAAGDVVTVEADEADNVPTYVLLPLYGADLTLQISHEGETYTLTDDSIGAISSNQVYFTFEKVAEFDAGEEAAE